MTLKALLVATGFAVATIAAAAPSSAQTVTTTTRTTTVRSDTGIRAPVVVVRDHRPRRLVCRTTWRNHHRVRRCFRR